ncbi:MFS general substrate transporter [Patellaria atrata CBS 101060]|uniref:MFS general substrate transporter n=1 Tax=Patellaria atrata CBS 101060 TaxID=1346257 RepID=A0A9P4S610_9PEZI|nr:MFS general substrate transporter [Patellaria atrata CBS 101060]
MDLNKGLVGWDSVEDTTNPLNWTGTQKAMLTTFIGFISALVPCASSLTAPGIGATMQDLNETSDILGSLMITIYVAGIAVGPLFLGPLSEIFGRYPVLICSSWFHVIFLIACGLAPTFASLIVFRLFAGVGAAAALTLAPAIVGDIFPIEKRAFGNTIVIFAQCLGPVIGPICGGFITEQLGWRWAYWILLCFTGTTTVAISLFMRESYPITILQKKTKRLQKELNRPDLKSQLHLNYTKKELLSRSLIRPMKLLTRSPIIFLLSLYIAIMYGILYLMFTTITPIFQDTYGWSLQVTGLAYLGIGVGSILALAILLRGNDAKVVKLRKRNNGVYEPEMRLPDCLYYAILVPIGIFWYGWTSEREVHWSVPIIGLIPYGFGMAGIFVPGQTYMIDSFPQYAASTIAAAASMRSLFGTFMPLAGPHMYKALGLGWGNTLLGALTAALVPIVWCFYRYGKTIRKRWPVEL